MPWWLHSANPKYQNGKALPELRHHFHNKRKPPIFAIAIFLSDNWTQVIDSASLLLQVALQLSLLWQIPERSHLKEEEFGLMTSDSGAWLASFVTLSLRWGREGTAGQHCSPHANQRAEKERGWGEGEDNNNASFPGYFSCYLPLSSLQPLPLALCC